MRSIDAAVQPRESPRSPNREVAGPLTSARRLLSDGGEDTAVEMGNDAEQTAPEEKIKVVVRVRPLQKSEEPWSTSPNCSNGDDTEGLSRSTRKHRGIPAVSPSSALSAESALSLHDRSVAWEKNGQIKILLADAVFGGDAIQDDVFHSVEDCVDGLLAGYDCSVFAYGQTGTGKTYTMSGLPHRGGGLEPDHIGGSFTMSDSFGVVPRCIQRLFDQVETCTATDGPEVSFSLYCSFVEIYNEKIYDILTPDVSGHIVSARTTPSRQSHDSRVGWNRPQPIKEAPSLQMRQKMDGTVFVDGLTSRRITSRAEMLRAFQEGSMNREVTVRKNVSGSSSAQTKVSNGSPSPRRPPSTSTSAAPGAGQSKSRLSRLFFVDLAGSEKWHTNGSDLNDRYAAELSSINKSLSALTNCVLALTQKERPHVPYRDSVLTRLLQSCLQGHGRTAFIVTISPARESLEESFATLRFAERLKALRCRPIRRKIFANETLMGEQRTYYENQIQTMRMEVNRLRELLKKAHRRNQEIADNTAAAANAALLEENRRLKELLMNSERNRLAERGERTSGKASKATAISTTDPSPQRKVAKQIIASAQRPFSKEEATPKSIPASEVDASTDSRQIQPSTPPARSSPIRLGSMGDESEEMPSDTKAYSMLVNRLQDKEARLNWMLEAELEAQNARSTSRSAIENTPPSQHSNTETQPVKPTITRSWAVERVLRKNLVIVPPPVRAGNATLAHDHTSATRAVESSESISSSLPRSIRGALNSKLDSPRHATTTSSAFTGISQLVKGTQPVQQSLQSETPRVPRAPQSDMNRGTAIKPASLLKLVGSAEARGKSKDELVDDYKRARRAELEAMLRTMVQR